MRFEVIKAPLIDAEITVPGDKSISHRAVMIAALSNGICKITNFLEGEDCIATMEAMRRLGVRIDHPAPGVVIVHGTNGRLTAPTSTIDCGNSGTSVRLLSGILAAQQFRTRMTGDDSLRSRPMRRVMEPLLAMGADIRAEGPRDTLPLVIDGRRLHPIRYTLPVASAQVKSAILLAGLFTPGKTTVVEPTPTRDHTERMLEHFMIRCLRVGNEISIYGPQIPESRDFAVPGDISSAAFWLVAAAAQAGSQLHIRNVGLNPTRIAIIGVLVRMGAKIREAVTTIDHGEPCGSIEIQGAALRATMIEGDEIPNIIDEIPAISIAAALAEGTTTIRGARELRVKETDRISAISRNLRAMGAHVVELDDGMEITGPARLRGAPLESFGDHRIAMAFSIAGLFADGITTVDGAGCVHTSYPGFEETLDAIVRGERLRLPPAPAPELESELQEEQA